MPISDSELAELRQKYGLQLDANDKYISIDNPRDLLVDAMTAVGNALIETRNFSDDDVDYINAAIDQLQFLHNTIFDDDLTHDHDESITTLLAILNSTRAELEENNLYADNHAYGFIYGYADHASPISDLMHANLED